MKSYVWYVCLCAILTFLASPTLLANFHTDSDGGGWVSGDASGSGWGSSCTASAIATGSYLSSSANYWASKYFYTDEAGYFYVNWDLDGDGSVSYYDSDGSGASGTGAGGGSGYGESTSDGVTLWSTGAHTGNFASTANPGIHGGTETTLWFDALDGVNAYSTCAATASVGASINWVSSSGNGAASVTLSND